MTTTEAPSRLDVIDQISERLAPALAEKMPSADPSVPKNAAITVASRLVDLWGIDSTEIRNMLSTLETKMAQERQIESLASLLEEGVSDVLQDKGCIETFELREETTAIGVKAMAQHLVYTCGYDNPDVS